MPKSAAVILAAGQGTRMKSRIPKILHEVGGLPMVVHVFEAAAAASTLRPVIVISPGDERLRELFAGQAQYVEQPEQLGTGHATRMAESLLRNESAQVLVTYADMPLLRTETMKSLAVLQATAGAAVSMLVAAGDPGSSFGRIVRANNGRVHEIVEVAEARSRPDRERILAITELNVGVYCFASEWLWDNLPRLPLHKARSGEEYYLTDMVELAVKQGLGVEALMLKDPDEALGAGTRAELIIVDRAFRRRVNTYWLEHGVTIVDPDTTYIDQSVRIGPDTIILPNTHIRGATSIGRNCLIGPNSIVRSSTIGDDCSVESSLVEDYRLVDSTQIRAFSHLKGSGSE